MKNTFGTSVAVTLFGESHGEETGVVVDGFAPGADVDVDYIKSRLSLRRPCGSISTARIEDDEFRIVSGVLNGKTTGAPICILIPNKDARREDYENVSHVARPGHADYTAYMKYHGLNDVAGGGHFSGRLTAPLVAAGAIAQSALKKKNIYIGTHIARCGGIDDDKFSADIKNDIDKLEKKIFGVINDACGDKMQQTIKNAASNGDSVGGILETAVIGLPAGLGEPWFGGMESLLSSALFGIPAIKGVSFGDGFDIADMTGSEANDEMRMGDGKVITKTNHNGGILGGITNGMPVIFRCAVKPTPSICMEQESVDFIKKENASIIVAGRHDPAIVHRARVVVDSVTALVMCDVLAQRYGTDRLTD